MSATDIPTGRDEQLGAARVVDWRFLLDGPVLDDVLIVGAPRRPGVVDALRAVSTSVRSADAGSQRVAVAAGISVVVLCARDAARFARAAGAVRPGGWLVAETDGLIGVASLTGIPGRLRAAGRLRRGLRRAGFEPVETWLAWPTHERTAALIPIDQPLALTTWLRRRYGPSGLPPILASGLARLAIASGLLAAIAAVTVTARRREHVAAGPSARAPERDPRWLWRCLRSVPPERLAPVGRSGSMILLTPRFRTSAHVIGLALGSAGSEDGEPWAVIKAARLAGPSDTLGREAAVLRSLEAAPAMDGRAPRVLGLDEAGMVPFLVETVVGGRPLDPATVRGDRDAAAVVIADLVTRLPWTMEAADDAPFDRLVLPSWRRLEAAFDGPGGDAGLVRRTGAILERAIGARLPTVVEHGDLAHPNLLLRSDGVLGAVDWERAEPAGLPLHDLTMGLAYVAGASAGATSQGDAARAFADALGGPDPWAGRFVDAELARLGVGRTLRGPLLLAPWLRTAAWLLERTSFEWLMRDRSVALWRAMLDVAERAQTRSGRDRP